MRGAGQGIVGTTAGPWSCLGRLRNPQDNPAHSRSVSERGLEPGPHVPHGAWVGGAHGHSQAMKGRDSGSGREAHRLRPPFPARPEQGPGGSDSSTCLLAGWSPHKGSGELLGAQGSRRDSDLLVERVLVVTYPSGLLGKLTAQSSESCLG